MLVKITKTKNRIVKDVLSVEEKTLIETERYDRTDNGARNVCRVRPKYYEDHETKENKLFGFQFLFINGETIHHDFLALVDIEAGKSLSIGNYDFTYLIFKDESTSYTVDKDFYEKTFNYYKERYID